MAGPSWLGWPLAGVFLAVAGYCVVRLVAAHRVPAGYGGCHRALDVAHLVMAAGMAVMCSPVGGPVPAAGWQTAFVLLAAWFLGSAGYRLRTGVRSEPIGWHGAGPHHAVAALAMLYMLSSMPDDARQMAMPWMTAHHAAAGFPLAGWALAAYFAGYAVVLGPRLLRPPPTTAPRVPPVLSGPRIAATCQLTMALGMSYLFLP